MTKAEIDVITHKIIGCAMKVHNFFGNGFQESIYQRSLELEMSSQGLAFERELEMEIIYAGQLIGKRRADFYVENCVLVELKAIEKLTSSNKAQIINYLETYNKADGLLINFGALSLEFKRVYNKYLVSV